MENILKIMFGFENCEVLDIDKEDIDYLFINEITEGLYMKNNIYRKTKACKNFMIRINKNKTDYKRIIEHNDIVDIHIILKDNTEECIYVDWNDAEEYRNINQETKEYEKHIDINIKELVKE
jgi:isocitrate/isopropylmalate dehydrogenase